jgi:hypothetical protein
MISNNKEVIRGGGLVLLLSPFFTPGPSSPSRLCMTLTTVHERSAKTQQQRQRDRIPNRSSFLFPGGRKLPAIYQLRSRTVLAVAERTHHHPTFIELLIIKRCTVLAEIGPHTSDNIQRVTTRLSPHPITTTKGTRDHNQRQRQAERRSYLPKEHSTPTLHKSTTGVRTPPVGVSAKLTDTPPETRLRELCLNLLRDSGLLHGALRVGVRPHLHAELPRLHTTDKRPPT